MTILHDLYRNPNAKRRRVGRSEGGSSQRDSSDCADCSTRLHLRRPDSEKARAAMESRTLETAFLADWVEMVFLHFEVDAERLQEVVPMKVDRFRGSAYVSLVGFTMKRFRPAMGGVATRWTTALLASQRFLNLRTYVKHGGQTGIYFLQEWLNHRLAVALGPRTFGLPYRYAEVEYEQDEENCRGRIQSKDGEFLFRGWKDKDLATAGAGTLNQFLLERYTAFSSAGKHPRYFRVWHRPWKVAELKDVDWKQNSILEGLEARWTETARFVGGQWSPGVFDVWMGRPHAVA